MSQVIVITGGSAGVGRATAREFARHGDRIAVLAHSPRTYTAIGSFLAAVLAAILLPCRPKRSSAR